MTIVQYEDKTLTLSQTPYLAGTDSAPCFRASAQDERGNAYLVTWWGVKSNWRELEDNSDCCDWSRYEVAEL